MDKLINMILVFAPLSLVSFGGGQAIMADMQYQSVEVQSWLTHREFADFFAISRAAPGPTTLIVALIGWHAAGLAGAITCCLAIYVPSSLLVYHSTGWWLRQKESLWRRSVEKGLAPVAVGLIFAGCTAVARSLDPGILALATIAAALAILYFTKIGSYTLMGAVLGIYLLGYFAL